MRKVFLTRQKHRKYKEESIEDERREINHARELLGLQKISHVTRKCLGCNETFEAQLRTNNFFCEPCRNRLYGEDSWEF